MKWKQQHTQLCSDHSLFIADMANRKLKDVSMPQDNFAWSLEMQGSQKMNPTHGIVCVKVEDEIDQVWKSGELCIP